MTTPQLLAKHLLDVHFGGNWTGVNLKDQLADVSLEEALANVHGLNSILRLTYHIHYYVHTLLVVLQGGPLDAHDKFSFEHPAITKEEEWQAFLGKVFQEAEACATGIERTPEKKLQEVFVLEKYGSYHRNMLGLIEHTHYHLGQIVVLKKLIRTAAA